MGRIPVENDPRTLRFVEEYLLDLNQTQAAIRAGFPTRSAANQASLLMKNPKVRARVDTAIAARSARTGVNTARVLRELARIGFASAPDFIDMDNATIRDGASADDKAAIASVKVKHVMMGGEDGGESIEREIKLWDKPKTLETLAKHLGMLTGPKDQIPGILTALVEAVGNVK